MDINKNELLNTIKQSYSERPRDVATTPQRNTAPRWFYVYSDGKNVFVESGHEHINKSKITNRIILDKNSIIDIYSMYCQYKRGLMLRKEIRDRNRNSSYWFGIFSDLHL